MGERLPFVCAMGVELSSPDALHAFSRDRGNSAKSVGIEIEAKTRSRISSLRQASVELGRDPEALRRALFVFPPLERWASADGFRDLVDRYTRIGVQEFFFPIPRDDQMSAFEKIAADVLPDYRTNT